MELIKMSHSQRVAKLPQSLKKSIKNLTGYIIF